MNPVTHDSNVPPAEGRPRPALRVAAMCGAFAAALALAPLSGCNTAEGAGEDIEAVGQGIEEAVDGS